MLVKTLYAIHSPAGNEWGNALCFGGFSINDRTKSLQTTEQICHKQPKILGFICTIQ